MEKATNGVIDMPCSWSGEVDSWVEVNRYHQVIVTELRSMDAAPKDGKTILAFNAGINAFEEVYYSFYSKCWVWSANDCPAQQKLIGWISMPRYIPKEAIK